MATQYQKGKNTNVNRNYNNTYIYGNTVRKRDVYDNTVKKEKINPIEQQKEKERLKEERRRAALQQRMTGKYVAFLSFAAMFSLCACVGYLMLHSTVYNNSKTVTAMQRSLSDLKEANATRYSSLMNSINLIEVREKAMLNLGMIYPVDGQVVEYDKPGKENIIQYHNIPVSGIIASDN